MTPLPFLLCLLGPILLQAKAAAPPPELAATVQFSPTGDFGALWQTYVVDLESRSARDLDLNLRIEDDSFLAIATRRELLAPGARKRVFLYAPALSYQRGIPVRYRITDPRGSELTSGIVQNSNRGIGQNAFQIALFCRIPAAEDDFGIPSVLNSLEVRCGRLATSTFPDRWIGLSSLDLIVLHDVPLDELTTDQGRALQEYVRYGGTVLLIPGSTPGWLSHPVIQSLAAVRADPPRSVQALPGLAGAFSPFRTTEAFLAQTLLNGAPALDLFPPDHGRDLVRFDSGLGRVFAVGVDLRHAPFDTWPGRKAFWSFLLGHTPRWYDEEPLNFPIAATAAQRNELFQRMGKLINPYPSFGLIFGLAVVFLAIVGPVNYAVLGKLRRTLLLVVTVPGISIAFLGLIVMLGYFLKGTSTVAHSARLLSTRSGLGVARETQLYSLFSPSTRTYDVTFEPGTYGPYGRSTLYDRSNFRRRQETLTTVTIDCASSLSIRGLSAGQWQSWDLETRALRDLGKGIRFSLEGSQLKIRNGSSRVIERGLYVQTGAGGTTIPLPGIDAGKDYAAMLTGMPQPASDALGLPSASLGDTLLRPWLDSLTGPAIGAGVPGQPQRFLLCILREEGTPVTVDARLSTRSRSITLLHVAEAP